LWPQGSAPSENRLFPWLLAKAFLSSPAALDATVRERLKRLDDGAASVSQDARQSEWERQALTHRASLGNLSVKCDGSREWCSFPRHLRRARSEGDAATGRSPRSLRGLETEVPLRTIRVLGR